jgi:formate dehydrogenase major subunit
VHDKELYMPMNSMSTAGRVDEAVNRLTSSHTDKATHTPAYKETSVRMKVLPNADGVAPVSPLPRTNSRFGHPTPQAGVEVNRKWKRSDYRMPGSEPLNQLVQIQTKTK